MWLTFEMAMLVEGVVFADESNAAFQALVIVSLILRAIPTSHEVTELVPEFVTVPGMLGLPYQLEETFSESVRLGDGAVVPLPSVEGGGDDDAIAGTAPKMEANW